MRKVLKPILMQSHNIIGSFIVTQQNVYFHLDQLQLCSKYQAIYVNHPIRNRHIVNKH